MKPIKISEGSYFSLNVLKRINKMRGHTKIKLELDLPIEAVFILMALEDRYKKVVNDELLWDSWELSANSRLTDQLKKYLKKKTTWAERKSPPK